jgi:hypothetical protein
MVSDGVPRWLRKIRVQSTRVRGKNDLSLCWPPGREAFLGRISKGIFSAILGIVLFCPNASAQANWVTGKVMDEQGNPIPFVSVLIKKNQKGVSTDTAGLFKIRIKPNTVLIIRAVGFEEAIVDPGNQRSLSIVLKAAKGSTGNLPAFIPGLS